MVRADVDRIPLGHLGDGVGDGVAGKAQARCRWKDISSAREIFLDDIVLRGALQPLGIDALTFSGGDVESQERPKEGRGIRGDASAVITGDLTAFCRGDILPNDVRRGETGLKAPPSAATPPRPCISDSWPLK